MTKAAESPQELVAQCQGLVRSLAGKIHQGAPPQVELDDLISYGQIGLAEAARDFDPSKEVRFSTYAYYRIRGAIYDGLAKMAWFSRAQYHRMRYERLANETLQVDSSDSPLPAASGEDDLRWFKRLTGALAVVHLVSQAAGEDECPGDANLIDSSVVAPDEAVSQQEICQRLSQLIDGLPADASALMKSIYFEGLTLKDAGERLGIGKAWACRLHARNLDRLARALRRMGVDA